MRPAAKAAARGNVSACINHCLKTGILLLCNTFPDDTGATTSMVEGFSWVVERPRPESDVIVAAFTCHADGEVERLVRVDGLDRTDYMQPIRVP